MNEKLYVKMNGNDPIYNIPNIPNIHEVKIAAWRKSLRKLQSMPSLIKLQANCKSNQSFTHLRHMLITRCQTKNLNILPSISDIFSFVTWMIYAFCYIICFHINFIATIENVIQRISIHHNPISFKSYPTLLE